MFVFLCKFDGTSNQTWPWPSRLIVCWRTGGPSVSGALFVSSKAAKWKSKFKYKIVQNLFGCWTHWSFSGLQGIEFHQVFVPRQKMEHLATRRKANRTEFHPLLALGARSDHRLSVRTSFCCKCFCRATAIKEVSS